jgi:hypothetical protein
MKIRGLFVLVFIAVLIIGVSAFSFNSNIFAKKGELKVTLEHPFLINDSWVKASELKVGDELFTVSGKRARIINIKNVKENVAVYNIHVNGNENYFANGILVHNKPDIEFNEGPTYVEELNKIKKADPEMYNWIMVQRQGQGAAIKNVPEFARIMEQRINSKETYAIISAIKNRDTSIKLPLAENEIGWNFDEMERWIREHGPGAPAFRMINGKSVPVTLFPDPDSLFVEAIHMATWKDDVSAAIKRESKRPLPRFPAKISSVIIQTKDIRGDKQLLKWYVIKRPDGSIIVDLYHAEISKIR